MNISTYRRQLWESAANQLLPCLRDSGQWQSFLAEPPFLLPPNCDIKFHPGKPLSMRQASNGNGPTGHTRIWREVDVHTSYAPYIGYVLEGEIDLRIGITKTAVEHLAKPYAKSDYAIISIPKHTFFVIPPGVPHGRGTHGHWERPEKPQNAPRIFWIHFFAPGIKCHESWYSEEGYILKDSYFLSDAHLLPAINSLIAEFHLSGDKSLSIIHSLLLFIMHRVERDLRNFLPSMAKTAMPSIQHSNTSSQIVEQACAYIETHYQESVSVERIAAHCFVSSSHLSHLFKAAKKMTLHEYLTRTRLDYACILLKESRLGIRQIGITVGYTSHSHFCQIFSRELHCSPSQYRNEQNY